MATKRKVKRYADEGAVYEDDTPEEVANRSASSQAIANEDRGDTMLKAMRDEAATAPTPTATAKPRASAPKADVASALAKTMAANKATPAAKSADYSNEGRYKAAPTATAKKETYRDVSGKVQTKASAADRDADMAARRESLMSGIKNVGSSIGNMFSRAKQNYESTRPVSKQVQKERDQAAARGNLAKGGMASSASKRADGIAQRGKTRGKMC